MYASSICINECECREEISLGVGRGEIISLPFRAFAFISFGLIEVVSEIWVRAEAWCAHLWSLC